MWLITLVLPGGIPVKESKRRRSECIICDKQRSDGQFQPPPILRDELFQSLLEAHEVSGLGREVVSVSQIPLENMRKLGFQIWRLLPSSRPV